jgi:hypothetical protein
MPLSELMSDARPERGRCRRRGVRGLEDGSATIVVVRDARWQSPHLRDSFRVADHTSGIWIPPKTSFSANDGYLSGNGANQDFEQDGNVAVTSLPRMRTAITAVSCLFFFASATLCQQPALREITIESGWGGLGDSQSLNLAIESRDGVNYLGKDAVDPKLVDALISSLSSPPLPAPTLGNLGVTAEWLEQNAADFPRDGAPNQKALFRQNFADPKTIEQLLPFAFEFAKFDDYPHLTVTVVFANGQRWTSSSDSYYPYMLPWKVNVNGNEQTTYNADISRALAALMPISSLNRDRLNDEELKQWLARAVMTHITEQWDLLGVENRAPGSLDVLRRNFEVQRASISPYRSEDFGYNQGDPRPHEENLLATLRQPSLPPGVAEEVVLLFHDGKIEGVGEIADRIAPYVALALSVPWLNEYRIGHPEQKMYIRFVHDRSFSDKAMRTFTADMEKLGKQSLADEVAKVQDKAAMVFLDYGSSWIILPDKRMILWRHYRPATFLKWTEADFKFERCADYNANGGGCVGMLVSADGTLQR